MQYSTKNLPKSEIEIIVSIPFAEFEPHVRRAAGIISEETEIEGFRRGKAPFDLVKKKVGEAAIYEKAADLAVQKTYVEVMEKVVSEQKNKEEFIPIGKPEVSVLKIAPGNDFEYKIKIALLPRVTISGYKSIAGRLKKEKKDIVIEDSEVEKTLEWIRESRAPLITVDREAKEGDRVEIDFEVRHGGVKIEGGESRDHPMIIGKGKFLPGFEEKLVGMKAGEEKEFSLVAPDDWYEKNLAGKPLEFKATMKLVQEKQLPPIDDNFAKGLGSFENLEGLKINIREGIFQEKKEKESQRIKSKIIEEIASEIKAELPEVLIESEIEKMVAELQSGVTSMGLKWEDYLLHIKKTSEELKRDWRSEAEKRVRIALALRAIAEEEKVEVSEEEIETRANDFLRQYGTPIDAAKTIDAAELRDYMRGLIRNEKVFEILENS